jgi:hypothetical protein
MTQENLAPIKSRLREYLQLIGHPADSSGKVHCPFHDDKNPSASIKDDRLHCFVCNESWDILDISGKLNSYSKSQFPENIKAVKKVLNMSDASNTPTETRFEKEPAKAKAVTHEQALKIYTKERFNELAEFNRKQKDKFDWGKFVECYPYYDENGLIDLVDVRYENNGKKTVISCWYNGYTVKSSGSPLKIFNRHLLKQNPTIPRIIVEGTKNSYRAQKKISEFIFTTGNRLSTNADKHDYTPIGNQADIYIIMDDDHKINIKTGKEFPWYLQPGAKAARKIQSKIHDQLGINAKIIPHLLDARKIKPDGADIVEWFEIRTPEEIVRYIIESEPVIFPTEPEDAPPPKILTKEEIKETVGYNNKLPFRILGRANDHHLYFITYQGVVYSVKPDQLSKGKLMEIAPLEFWISRSAMCHGGNQLSRPGCDEMIDWLIQTAGSKKFNVKNILGRGVFENEQGEFYYWDGEKFYGNPDQRKVHEQKDQIDIGLDYEPASPDLCREIASTVFKMTFKTKVDALRILGWSALASFSGVLPYRPSILLTGVSESGKSTVIDYICKRLAIVDVCDAEQTTPIGIIQDSENDNYLTNILDEADISREKRKALFGLMRSSFQKDAMKSKKGTVSHTPVRWDLKMMFLFSCIDPVVENPQDENRMFPVDMIRADRYNELRRKEGKEPQDFAKLSKDIKRLMTPENAKKIRSLIWSRLKEILSFADELSVHIQEHMKISPRRAYAEALLFSAYWLIWAAHDSENIEAAKEKIIEMYKVKPPEDPRDVTKEMIDKIMDYRIFISDTKKELTIMEILQRIATGKIKSDDDTGIVDVVLSKLDIMEYKRVARDHGITVDLGKIAIAKKHDAMMKILDMRDGYYKRLRDHVGYEGEKNVYWGQGVPPRGCIIIGGILDDVPF